MPPPKGQESRDRVVYCCWALESVGTGSCERAPNNELHNDTKCGVRTGKKGDLKEWRIESFYDPSLISAPAAYCCCV